MHHYLFGGGELGCLAMAKGVQVEGVVDVVPNYIGRTVGPFTCGYPWDIPRDHMAEGVVLLIAHEASAFAAAACLTAGMTYQWLDVLDLDAFDSALLVNSQPELYRAAWSLADDESRDTLCKMFYARLFHDPKDIVVSGYERNNHPEVRPRGVCIDGGAYLGKSAREMLERGADRVIACEPAMAAFSELKQQCIDGVDPWCVALGDRAVSQRLSIGGWDERSNRLDTNLVGPGETVSVGTIDTIAATTPIGFIALNIEGAELEALKGGAETIRRDRPGLAISAYHKPSHLWEVIEAIKAICSDYHLWVGHHSQYYTATTVYGRCDA